MQHAMSRLADLTRRRWFGDATLGAICVLVVVLAAVLTPSTGELSFFGIEVPVLCTFRRLTGLPCPGCGLTRSFTFMAHGRVLEAFQMNLIGPFVFAFVAAQIPLRAWRVRRIVRGA